MRLASHLRRSRHGVYSFRLVLSAPLEPSSAKPKSNAPSALRAPSSRVSWLTSSRLECFRSSKTRGGFSNITFTIFVPSSEIDAAREAGAETLAAIEHLEGPCSPPWPLLTRARGEAARKIQTDVGRVHALSEEMRAMMAAAAEDGFDDLPDNETREGLPVSLGDWLSTIAKTPGGLVRKSMVARAMWQSKSRASGLFVSMVFRCQLVVAD